MEKSIQIGKAQQILFFRIIRKEMSLIGSLDVVQIYKSYTMVWSYNNASKLDDTFRDLRLGSFPVEKFC